MESTPPPGPRRLRRKVLWFLAPTALVFAVLWLNGPGLRWLAPVVAGHFIEKAGLRGGFSLDGSLTGGVTIRDLRLESDAALALLTLKRARPAYRIMELPRGRISGLEVDGLHAEIRLGLQEKEAPEEKPPFDANALAASMRDLRGFIIPLTLDLRNISVRATRDSEVVFQMEPSRILHLENEALFKIDLAEITTAGDRRWPSQQSQLAWEMDAVALDRLDPWPGVGLREVVINLPGDGGFSVDGELRVNEAVFVLSAVQDSGALNLDLREGTLDSRWIGENFAITVPFGAELSSLSLNAENLVPDPTAATGAVRVLLENVSANGWEVPELSLDFGLQADRATLAASGRSTGTPFAIDVEAPLTSGDAKFKPGQVRGRFRLDDLAGLGAGLSQRFPSLALQSPAPQSVADGEFELTLDDMKPVEAEAGLTLTPLNKDDAAALKSRTRWRNGAAVETEIETEGAKLKATWQPEQSAYKGELALDGFQSARIGRWLAMFRELPDADVVLSGNWRGEGDPGNATHRGSLSLANILVRRGEAPEIRGGGSISYDWPRGFDAENLSLGTEKQVLTTNASMADGFLSLRDLRWSDDGAGLLSGAARLPVPEDITRWRTSMKEETRPMRLEVKSAVLPLVKIRDWFPAAAKIDPRASGSLSIDLAGTYASPRVDSRLQVRDFRLTGQERLPPANLDLTLKSIDARLALDGRLTTPGYPPATLGASMPFRPERWMENPEILRAEPLTARADLPRLDLSRFASLLPGARQLTGFLTGFAECAGTISEPVVQGRLDLARVGLVMASPDFPPVTAGAATVDLALDRITLRDLGATIAGGTLRGAGSVEIVNGRPKNLDLTIQAGHLPLLRNESMIVRANADLRLAGELPQASVTGSVGIIDSLFYRDIELLPIGMPFTTPSAAALPRLDRTARASARLPEPFNSWTLDARVSTQNPFLIRGNFAKGSVTGDVRIGGTLGAPAPDGEVRVADLRAALPFSTLTVRSGSLRFTPEAGFDPMLEIRGTSEPRPYRVNGYVYGRASDPQLVLTSSPPLPENEIMTLLATGTTTSGLEDPQAASSRAMQLLIEEMRRGRFGVGRRLRPLLGLLDNVDFSIAEADPYSNESFSTATLAITDRWFVSAGMGEDGDSRFLGIWRLSFH